MKLLPVIIFFLTSGICKAQTDVKYRTLNLDSIFGKIPGTFVLYELKADNFWIYNYERAKTEYSVHSTSKIFWSIIGLEEWLVKSELDTIKWDSIRYSRKDGWPMGWNTDQTIVSALSKSVNWYYFELLSMMTPELVEKYLNKLDYQKGFKVERLHYFGLTYNIKKSALDQIEFLKSLYNNDFDLSDKTIVVVKEGMLNQKTDKYTLYSKTGLGPINDDSSIGWYIGYIEKGDQVYFFALNVEDEDERNLAALRIDYSIRILNILGLL